jgi:transcriptional regulator with XRE-family HTH domain
MLGWSQDQLAEVAGLSRATIVHFERGERTPSPCNILAVRTAFEMAGLEFSAENGGSVGVRSQQPRERSTR